MPEEGWVIGDSEKSIVSLTILWAGPTGLNAGWRAQSIAFLKSVEVGRHVVEGQGA